MVAFASVVLFSDRPERTIAFYRALGIALHTEEHGDGVAHAAAELDDIHFAVFKSTERDGPSGSAPSWRSGGDTFIGLYVDSLEATRRSLVALGANTLVEHEVREWACRSVVEDPDGRPVEINERDHC